MYREPDNGVEEKEALRKRVFALAGDELFDFDSLCDRVLASMPE